MYRHVSQGRHVSTHTESRSRDDMICRATRGAGTPTSILRPTLGWLQCPCPWLDYLFDHALNVAFRQHITHDMMPPSRLPPALRICWRRCGALVMTITLIWFPRQLLRCRLRLEGRNGRRFERLSDFVHAGSTLLRTVNSEGSRSLATMIIYYPAQLASDRVASRPLRGLYPP
ncbi:hypothetical protein B0H21DRAFT_151840 [Amylocystis lapponica]|nr:hypothetical protein B0H21DRAFT_151840 [Amylocystis lapponica]